jgi:hypothetical protein
MEKPRTGAETRPGASSEETPINGVVVTTYHYRVAATPRTEPVVVQLQDTVSKAHQGGVEGRNGCSDLLPGVSPANIESVLLGIWSLWPSSQLGCSDKYRAGSCELPGPVR